MVGRVVIIGAGQAGFAAAAKLRQEGFAGAITLLGDEGSKPYQRPPLSKAYLLGKLEENRLSFRNDDFFDTQNIAILDNEPALAIDRAAKQVVTANGRHDYDQLILATGASPIRLPARMTDGIANIFYLRTKADADRLRPMLTEGARLLVVGGGYVGLEVAAAARQADVEVTLVEMAPRILNRVAAEPTAAYFRTLHGSKGVAIRESVALADLMPADTAIAASFADGSGLIVDAVVVGIGVRPNSDLARTAGLDVDGGIVVDAFGRTSDPCIWAAGDCAAFLHEGAMTRMESVPHAIDQAEHVARNVLGASQPYRPRPWFWSDQFDTKLQIAGLNRGYDQATVSRGANEGSMTVSYFQGERLVAVDCLNDARSFMLAKRQLGL
jgi:3-phenylpropionate/trans-cinnamate dioxygenase ferredoxin reductase subunit